MHNCEESKWEADMRLLIAAAALTLATDAAAQSPAPARPVWRDDLSFLASDRALIRECLQADAGRAAPASCAGVVRQACFTTASPEVASVTAFQRRCNWRAIAAWEDELAEARAALRAAMRPEELPADEAAHAAFEAFLIANVRSYGVEFEGGSLSNVAAGEIRARMLAERALELRARLADRCADTGC
jgi:hypothetical protein